MILFILSFAFSANFSQVELSLIKAKSKDEKVSIVEEYKQNLIKEKSKDNNQVYYQEEFFAAYNMIDLKQLSVSNCRQYEEQIRKNFTYRDNHTPRLHQASQDVLKALTYLCK